MSPSVPAEEFMCHHRVIKSHKWEFPNTAKCVSLQRMNLALHSYHLPHAYHEPPVFSIHIFVLDPFPSIPRNLPSEANAGCENKA